MTSSQETPDLASTITPGNFHQQFRRHISALQEQVDSLSGPETSSSDRQATIDFVRVGIARLSLELADVSGGLASYDQRSYIQAIKELQDKLTVVRASHAPKAKFSFKNKRLIAPTSEANSAATSRSATPTHLRDSDSQGGSDPTPAFASPSAHVLSNREDYHNDPGIKDFKNDDSHWIMIGAKQDAYLRQPPRTMVDKADELQMQQGKTCIVSDVSSSIVNLGNSDQNVAPSALTLNTIDTSLILAPDIKGAAHMTDLRNSVLVLACHQFRMHRSHNVDVYLHCPNRPIIEDCSNIRFTRLPDTLRSSGLNTSSDRGGVKQNLFDQVDDFKWLRNEASPNWRVMREDEVVGRDTWQGLMETLQQLDVDPNGSLVVGKIAQTLQDLKIKPTV